MTELERDELLFGNSFELVDGDKRQRVDPLRVSVTPDGEYRIQPEEAA